MPPKHQFNICDLIAENKIIENDLNEVKLWLKTTDIPILTDEQIALFLLSCNNILEQTQKTIRAYFRTKNQAPELFDNWLIGVADVQNGFQLVETAVMPKRTPENNVVILSRLKDKSYWNFNLQLATKILFMSLELPLYNYPPNGLLVILDMSGFTLLHLTKFKLGVIKHFFQYLQEGLPSQLISIHIFNCVTFFDRLLSILKPFMKKELIQMLNLHPPGLDMNDFFQKYIPADNMPEDYQGLLPNMKFLTQKTIERLKDMEENFGEEEKQRKLYKLKH